MDGALVGVGSFWNTCQLTMTNNLTNCNARVVSDSDLSLVEKCNAKGLLWQNGKVSYTLTYLPIVYMHLPNNLHLSSYLVSYFLPTLQGVLWLLLTTNLIP